MNTRHLTLKLIAAAVATLPLLAHADSNVSHDGWTNLGDAGGYSVYVGPPAGTIGKTRAEVQAELAAFRENPITADGWKNVGDGGGYSVYVGPPAGTLGKTRAEVRAELAAFRKNPIAADGWKIVGDGGYFVYAVQPGATASETRAQASMEREVQ
ncbi:MAG: SPOR domain-containing protein [Methylibium sp.]|uniref:SPOR domain-containing protein n=1 Tax=Methylibium sp. TaxID=2067992 RepID=UPI00181F5FE0|nr:SPOR domain-containing protein [Methylibium sp.]MBA3595974.1 SPOR domain-containing protein [Methylibium sp.]